MAKRRSPGQRSSDLYAFPHRHVALLEMAFSHASAIFPAMSEAPHPTRTVHCADARVWLPQQGVLEGCSFITSLPDVSELPHLSLDAWRAWFLAALGEVLACTPDDGVALFFQTDIKKSGVWIDKGYLCSRAAEDAGMACLFHKVVCRRAPGTVTFGRPAYSHLLAFSRGVRLDLSRATADVLEKAGESPWTRGMGQDACRLACRFVLENTTTRTIVDPFCGKGTVLAVANALGLSAVGVEISKKRARQANALRLDDTRPNFVPTTGG